MDVIPLIPGLHFLRFPIGHAYLWQDTDGLTLIDTSATGSAPQIAEAIRGLGHHPSDLRRLVLTHFHEDHVGSAAEIARWGEVTVHAHRADAPVIRGHEEGPLPELTDWERPLLERIQAQAPPRTPEPVRVDRELEDGDVLDFGGGARAVSAPGHTPGSVALHLPGPRVLFTGDTVARLSDGQVTLGLFNVDRRQAIDSFQRQAALDTDIACFGHGEPLTHDAAATLRTTAEHLRE
ncbi:MBL fold metallo-hydrolase [Saccharopolyspora sp. CA-218241]|uniref:MBL fold metallo-hydrolase n=1 Tax=Saccharopolyspora sp. CA-218241 TaxID=3240027 RepID=UPI003D977DF7